MAFSFLVYRALAFVHRLNALATNLIKVNLHLDGGHDFAGIPLPTFAYIKLLNKTLNHESQLK